jgi:hypothetical protein
MNATTTGTREAAPPLAAVDEPAKATRPKVGRWQWAKNPVAVLALAVLATFPSCLLGAIPEPFGHSLAAVALALVALASLFSAVSAVAMLVRSVRRRPAPDDLSTLGAVFLLPMASFWTLIGGWLSLWATMGFRRGRQLRSFGRILLPPVVEGEAWTLPREHELAAIDVDVRPALAAAWRENGRTEHASVAAFARLTLDLMDLGAPPELLVAAQNDALDEVRHAELCFGLARALDGRAEGPGPFPAAGSAKGAFGPRTARLAALAVSSLVDGALHEGISARVIARLARRCEVPSVAALLRTIARDEGRHAAHGWDVVVWCVAEGGRPIVEALNGALAALPAKPQSSFTDEARDGGWERYGLHGAELEDEEHAKTRAFLAERLAALGASAERRAAA